MSLVEMRTGNALLRYIEAERGIEIVRFRVMLVPGVALARSFLVGDYSVVHELGVEMSFEAREEKTLFTQETFGVHAEDALVVNFVVHWQVDGPYKAVVLLPKIFIILCHVVSVLNC